MEIGVTINYQNLGNYVLLTQNANFPITHIQINGLPAEIHEASSEIARKTAALRAEFPGLTFSLHAYKYNFTEKIDRVRRLLIEFAKETIGFAAEIQAGFVNFHAGFGSGGTRIKHQIYRNALIPVFQELVDAAAAHHLEMHLENLYPRPIHSEIRMLGDRPSDFAYFFEKIPSPFFKLCYDYGHGNIDEYGIEILRRFPERLGSIHASDNNQMADTHAPVGAPGLGTIDWTNELNYLKKINFPGPFILESSLENQFKSLEYFNKLS